MQSTEPYEQKENQNCRGAKLAVEKVIIESDILRALPASVNVGGARVSFCIIPKVV